MASNEGKTTGMAEELDLKKVDTEASLETDPVLDAKITRKLDLHILPWIFILWLLAFIDRSNIGMERVHTVPLVAKC
jgi:hypothetical protein